MELSDENRKYETLAWGALFIWLGIWWIAPEASPLFPAGAGAVGVGIIMLGLNLARWMKDIPINLCSTVLGATFLILGGMKLTCGFLNCQSCSPSLLGVLLIVLGTALLTRELIAVGKRGFGN